MKPLAWINPTTIAAAVEALGEPATQAKAGGIDLMDLLKERLVAPERLVNLRAIQGLDGIDEKDDGLHIGPNVTLASLAANERIGTSYRALAQAAGHAATPQIRNVATVAGNLLQRPRCWYFRSEQFDCRKKGGAVCFAQQGENAYHAVFDNQACAAVHPSAAAVALLALGAKLEVVTPHGPKTIELATLFVAPETDITREHSLGQQDVIASIVVPRPKEGSTSAYTKQGEKASFDWPLAEVAVALEMQGSTCSKATVVLGAAAPVPRRASAAEKILVGKPIDETTARMAAKVAMQGATPLAHNAYKVPIFQAIIRRTILAAGSAA